MSIKFGFHASSGGDWESIPLKVRESGGECFQFFSRSPYGGKALPLEARAVKNFKRNCQLSGISDYYIHAPYFINLASLNNRIFYGSIKALQDDIERAEILGAKYVVTHIGSAKDFKIDSPIATEVKEAEFSKYPTELLDMARKKNFSPLAFEQVVKGLEKITAGKKSVPLLIEIAAGAGAILGVKFEELAFYLESAPAVTGFCFDTAHAFASGYDLRSKEKLVSVFKKVENVMGKEKVKLVHVNDSKGDFGSRVDRHAHIGKGNLGEETFRNLVDYFTKKNYNVDMILETPTKEGLKADLSFLKQLRKKSEKVSFRR